MLRSFGWMLGLTVLISSATLQGQLVTSRGDEVALLSAPVAELPDAPSATVAAEKNAHESASVFGTVEGPNGSVAPGAKVFLRPLSGGVELEGKADEGGIFKFSNLPAGRYQLKAIYTGMGNFKSEEFELKEGESKILPHVVLPVGMTTTDVRVYADRYAIAEEEIHMEEQQRVLGVLPNFYSEFNWDAAPLGPKQKTKLALHSVFDPMAFVFIGVFAGAEQATDRYKGYGQGAEGYGKRYGAGFADDASRRMLGSAVFPMIFRQDPRYFVKGTGTTTSRLEYALSRALICRGDNGHAEFNFSKILGNGASGALGNLYYPKGDRGTSLALTNTGLGVLANMFDNVMREFVLKVVTTHTPKQ